MPFSTQVHIIPNIHLREQQKHKHRTVRIQDNVVANLAPEKYCCSAATLAAEMCSDSAATLSPEKCCVQRKSVCVGGQMIDMITEKGLINEKCCRKEKKPAATGQPTPRSATGS